MLPLADLLVIAGIALAVSAVTGALALLVLRGARRRPLGAQLVVVLSSAVVSSAVGMAAVAQQMYLSAHDLQVSLWVAATSGAASLLLALALGHRLARSSLALSRAVRSLGDGTRVAQAPAASGELAHLARELADAGERLAAARLREQQLEESRRQLVAWISHDLRTPLAGIRAVAEALEDGMVDDPARYHRRMRRQAEQLALLVDDLFELSSLDAGTLRLAYEEVSLLDVVSDAVADLRPLAGERGVVVESGLDRDVVVRIDSHRISRAISNLVTNSLQHAPAPTPVVVRAHLVDGRPAISVIDDGGGVSSGLVNAGLVDAGGRRGLGLSIVRGILAAHAGQVVVASSGRGGRVDLLLPLEATVLEP